MNVLRTTLLALVASTLLLPAIAANLAYSNGGQGDPTLADAKVLFLASKSGVYMSSLLFQGYACVSENGYAYPTPNTTFPSLQEDFVNGSPALLLAPLPSNDLTVDAGIVMAYGLEWDGNETYVNVIGTYNNVGAFNDLNGWTIYLFLTESSQYPYGNHSIPYWVTTFYPPASNETYKYPQLGELEEKLVNGSFPVPLVLLPFSTTPYLVVYFLPSVDAVYVYLVNFTSPNAPPNVTEIGMNFDDVMTNQGDAVLMSVTFSQGGLLQVYIKDLTNGEDETFVFNTSFHPSPGEYWTGVGGNSLEHSYGASWAILYWEIKSVAALPTSTSPTSNTSTPTTSTSVVASHTATATLPTSSSASGSLPINLETAIIVVLVVVVVAIALLAKAKR